MKGAAGMLSAAALLAPGCGSQSGTAQGAEEPVRRAVFRSLAARDFLLSCPAGAGRGEAPYHDSRFEELKQLAARKGAGRAIALGENDWAGLARYDEREPCEPGEEAYNRALAAYSGALDALAARVAAYGP